MGEGWDHWVWRADDWVFRFPKRADVVPHLLQELRVLPRLQHLPLPVPDPVRCEGQPFPFMGYPLLPGRPARSEAVLDELLPFLDVLHREPLPGVSGWPWAEELPAHPLCQRARAWLDAHALSEVPPVLVHGDLRPEHVLVSEEGRVVGIIDWGSLDEGDPARDLVGLYRSWPEAVAARVSPERCARIRWWAIRTVLDLAVLSGLEAPRLAELQRLLDEPAP